MTGWRTILDAATAACRSFDRLRASPRAAQWSLLHSILVANAQTEFGRIHHFDEISSPESFRSRVPMRTYDDFRPWIDRIAGGEAGILSGEPVAAFEKTGGSTSGRKLIPYTQSGLNAFAAAVLPWLAELAARRPGVPGGLAYVSCSPALRTRRTIGGVAVGLSSEGAYLGHGLAASFASIMAVPQSVASLTEVEAWRFATLLHLLATPDLTFISIWSPTFLIGLFDAMAAMREPLLRALRVDRARRSAIEKAFETDLIDTRQIWPRLDTLSTWADATSRPYARRLKKLFPHAMLQPKGLLATEGAITLPFGHHWPIPALASSFLEFVDDDGRVQLCDELREGANYRVVLTNSNGLYRYDLGDLVHCRGHADGLPLLEFVGRGSVCSDMVGEKLDERFVIAVLATIEQPACLLPHAAPQPFYELLVETVDRRAVDPLAALVERRLCGNPQYAYARAVGQLGPVTARVVKNLLDRHAHAEMQRGRRLADIKPPTLLAPARSCDDARIL
jgi:hypothetical protein